MALTFINTFQSKALQNLLKLGVLVWKQTTWQPLPEGQNLTYKDSNFVQLQRGLANRLSESCPIDECSYRSQAMDTAGRVRDLSAHLGVRHKQAKDIYRRVIGDEACTQTIFACYLVPILPNTFSPILHIFIRFSYKYVYNFLQIC
jgi:hypothetical protein